VNPLNYPLLIFVITFFLLWVASWVGARMHQRQRALADEDVRTDFGTVQAATLTLLGLIIGFSFSMATGRYDLRKNYEEAEANAIGTEYVRADLLPGDEASKVRSLLREYTAQRIRFYTAPAGDDIDQIRTDTGKVQDQLWAAVAQTANSQPTPIRALTVAGMNDVLNSEGYSQAAWWNRIPVGAWCLMFAIALFCNGLLGFGSRRPEPKLLLVLPLVVGVAFFLIADIDSPRGGVIRVVPQNLMRLQAGLK
jgi:lipopolysaccharide export LptBFGC system permease protein LptF